MKALIRFFSLSFFAPVHELGRKLLSLIATESLNKISSRSDSRHRWLLRNSATREGAFHLFLSDLDFSLILPDDQISRREAIDVLKRRYFFLKFLLPWLGELEIYSESEFNRRETLMLEWQPLFAVLTNIRKINWLTRNRAKTSSALTRYKCDRAIANSLKRLGVAPELALLRILESLGPWDRTLMPPEVPPPFLSAYLGCWLGSVGYQENYPLFALNPQKCWLAMALFPHAKMRNSALQCKIEILRADPNIYSLSKSIAEIESLLEIAFNRGRVSDRTSGRA